MKLSKAVELYFHRLQLREIAHHEAAHAVVSCCLGITPLRLSIVTIGESAGRVVYRAKRGWGGLDRQINDATISLSGPIATKKFLKVNRDRGGGRVDRLQATIAVASLAWSDKERRSLSRFVAARAERLVGMYWRQIQAVARHLVKHSTMTGKDVLAIMEKVDEQRVAQIKARGRLGRLPKGKR